MPVAWRFGEATSGSQRGASGRNTIGRIQDEVIEGFVEIKDELVWDREDALFRMKDGPLGADGDGGGDRE